MTRPEVPTSTPTSTPQPDDLSAYLTLNGWRREEGGHAASIWLNNDLHEDEGAPLLLPHVTTARDYPDRVSMLLEQLAGLRSESVEKVRRDAALVHFDVASIRAADETAIDDSIPLQAGLELFTAARKMIVAAAGATERRASHFGRSLSGKAREHSHVVRVGQTQRGSYIVPIISRARYALEQPVSEAHLDVEVEESLFDRRVMSTFARALGTLEELAVTHGRTPKGSEVTDAVSEGVSRELCTGVLKALKSPSISDLSVAFQWAPATTPPRGAPDSVAFPDSAKGSLIDLAERLRTLDLPRKDVLYGLVTELRHRPNDPARRVGVEALVGRRVRTVYMNLTPEQYEIAQACHERSKVLVQGQLRAPAGDRAEMLVESFQPDAPLDLDVSPQPARLRERILYSTVTAKPEGVIPPKPSSRALPPSRRKRPKK